MFCRVDKKTGEILEGPKPLPRNWGNVTGFNNLRAPDVKKYGWYEVQEHTSGLLPPSEDVSYLFLPEKEVVIQVYNRKNHGLREHALVMAVNMFAYRSGTSYFYSDVFGPVYKFPNGGVDQLHRINCVMSGVDYSCVVRDEDEVYKAVKVPTTKIPVLIEGAAVRINRVTEQLSEITQRIYRADELELKAMIDTSFADFYD